MPKGHRSRHETRPDRRPFGAVARRLPAQGRGPPPPPPIGGPPPAPPKPLPPPASYIGRWAATAELCAKGAWVFETDKVSTAGEVGCQFGSVSPTPTGYQTAASCTAEDRRSPRPSRSPCSAEPHHP
uniref:Uncharacterized protein n=1 Tax=Phenylobacterium glaciei TaxID=2803784 RepID=A0A974P1Q2_9CAUL|nr:hypothetical protein JKL49_19905 [Phenylobacterium glaciei]